MTDFEGEVLARLQALEQELAEIKANLRELLERERGRTDALAQMTGAALKRASK